MTARSKKAPPLPRFARGAMVTDRQLVAQLARDVRAEGGTDIFARRHRIAPWSIRRLLAKGSRCNPGPAIARLYGLEFARKSIVFRVAR